MPSLADLMRADAGMHGGAGPKSLSDLMRADAAAPTAPKQMSPQEQVLSQMSPYQRFMAGMGSGVVGLYEGAKQRLGLADQKEIDDYRAMSDPLTKEGAGKWGSVVGTGAAAAPAMLIPGANTYVGATALGSLMGAATPTQGNESAVVNTVLGGAGGAAGKFAGNYVQKLAKALSNRTVAQAVGSADAVAATGGHSGTMTASTTPGLMTGSGGGFGPGTVPAGSAAGLTRAQSSALENGQKMGFKLTPGQATGSVPLQQVEAFLESHPATSGPFNKIKHNNQSILNRTASAAIGEDGYVDSSALGDAANRIGGIYDEVRGIGTAPIEPDHFLNNLSSIENNYSGLIGDGSKSVLDHPLVSRLYNYAAKGGATGEQLTDLASKLTKASANHMTTASGDRQLGMALGDVKDLVDDHLFDGINATGNTGLADSFTNARSQYRNLMLLTGRQNVINPSSGNVNGRALASLLQAKDRPGFLFGKNQSPMYNAARFAQAFPPLVGDSGTATRMGTANPMEWLTMIPGNLVSAAYTSGPSVAMARGVQGAANASAPYLSPLAQGAAALSPAYSPLAAALLSKANQQNLPQP